MTAAMAGFLAQPAVQTISHTSSPSLRSSAVSRQRVACSLRCHSASAFPEGSNSPGRFYGSVLRASASSIAHGGDEPSLALGGGGNGAGHHGGGGSGGGGGDDSYGREGSEGGSSGGILGALWKGWQARVRADPQFAFKVLMEEIVGVGACVLGDMASRPNFGLNELDFVFCTLVVGSILNFSLMYMLAPTTAAGAVASRLPGIFASCPAGHMFEPGNFSIIDRAGTFVYKGAQFSMVGFAAGLVGTLISNVLLAVRKKVDPDFVVQNEAPPTMLNAATWALHMGLSSNARYQTLNGLEFTLASKLPPSVFKSCVLVVRALNNVVGGVSFVALARITGSQKTTSPPSPPQVRSEQEPLLELKEQES